MKRKNTIVRSGGGCLLGLINNSILYDIMNAGGGYFLLKKVSSTLIESEVADI